MSRFSFDDLFDQPGKPENKNYPLVFDDDQEPVRIICPTTQGPFIAGGACLQWFQDKPVGWSDIDIFCVDMNQFNELRQRLYTQSSCQEKYNTENASTLTFISKKNKMRNWTIQIISKRFYDGLEDVVNSFDISVCQIGTDGTNWVMGEHTASDIRNKVLRMNYPLQPQAAKRLVKYCAYGYRPVDGLIENIKQNDISAWKFTAQEEYE